MRDQDATIADGQDLFALHETLELDGLSMKIAQTYGGLQGSVSAEGSVGVWWQTKNRQAGTACLPTPEGLLRIGGGPDVLPTRRA